MDEFRVGNVSWDSAKILNDRVLPVPKDCEWYIHAVTTNKARCEIIRQNAILACQAYAQGSLPTCVYEFRATLRVRNPRGRILAPPDKVRVERFLRLQPDNLLENLPATLYVYVGMHVMVTKNLSLSLGQGNGTLGVVVGFVWPPLALDGDTPCG